MVVLAKPEYCETGVSENLNKDVVSGLGGITRVSCANKIWGVETKKAPITALASEHVSRL